MKKISEPIVRLSMLLGASIGILAAPVIVMLVVSTYLVIRPSELAPNNWSIHDCVSERVNDVKDTKTTGLYAAVTLNCYNERRFAALIQDFQIRRQKFYDQDVL